MAQHIANPLASPEQISSLNRLNPTLSPQDRELIFFTTSRLTQYAALLLKLPQSVGAQAVVLLQRYWVVEPLLNEQGYDFADISASILYTLAKTSAHPRSLRSICNIYTYLSTHPSPSLPTPPTRTYFVSDALYSAFTTKILHLEGLLLAALGFNIHVSLPHPLAITYLQALDLFSPSQPEGTGAKVASWAVKLLNTALLSPQLLYLTHQPNVLAVSAIYLASRQEGVSLPDEWWEVYDVEREELGFCVVGMLSLKTWAEEVGEEKLGRMVMRGDFQNVGVDEETEMARMMDRRADGMKI